MAKTKGKKTMKTGGLAAAVTIIIAGIIAAHFLDIFTLDDWKQLFGKQTAVAEGEAQVHFIDVGQGDCTLVISGEDSLLIDTGEKENAEKICQYMKKNGVDSLDYMLLTHPHSDHMGGASDIIKSIEVENVILPRVSDDMTPTTRFYENFLDAVSEKGMKMTAAEVGAKYEIGNCSLELIAPVRDYDDLNNYSVSAVLSHGDNTFLFTGDVEKKAEKDILENGGFSDVDVYSAAHHGSSTSNSKAVLDVINPEYIVISCGADNSYGHPHDEILDRFEDYADEIYRTDLNGTVVFRSSEDGFEIETEE